MADPIIHTERSVVRNVHLRWRKAYGEDTTYQKLRALDVETATAQEVATIIGNAAWVHVGCDGCGNYVLNAVTVGAEMDRESATATLCLPCVERAASVLRAAVASRGA